jgi:hypothetical protein
LFVILLFTLSQAPCGAREHEGYALCEPDMKVSLWDKLVVASMGALFLSQKRKERTKIARKERLQYGGQT